MDYWKKLSKPTKEIQDILEWGIPEQKTGFISVIGGNSQSFSTEVRITEFLSHQQIKSTQLILPDALQKKIPPIPGIDFTKSTEAGSFARSKELNDFIASTDFALVLGDVSKNSETSIALSDAIRESSPLTNSKSDVMNDTPILLTRDAVDSTLASANDFIERKNLFYVATLSQLQKLFRSLMYPKMILLSNPLMPVIEALHKFTLSYEGVTILTFHEGQIIVANQGNIVTIPLDATSYSAISLWSGELAAKIALLNLWNPSKPIDATTSAIFWN
ncbi:MAG: hypothetical protein Q4E47_00105 [Candidatus Saccharibacteria bacterium]|nr:hypothetical protein [Candidatus Saccharibacteria bacterium]